MFQEGLKNKIVDSDNKIIQVTRTVMVTFVITSEHCQHERNEQGCGKDEESLS